MTRNILISIILIVVVSGTLFFGAFSENHIVDTNPSDSNSEQTDKEWMKENLNQYKMNVHFDPQDRSLIAVEEVGYINKTNVNLTKIYFHLYPNAFKRKDTVPVLYSLEHAFPNGFEPGYIDIFNVKKSDGLEQKLNLNYEVIGNDSTIMRVDLDKPLQVGEGIVLELAFKVTIPPSVERFGYGEGFYNLGNWYPIVAMYDKTGWNLDPYYAIGDPFYSDIANYDVKISAPKDYIVAASGRLAEEKIGEDQRKTYHFIANSMRDFAWVSSNLFEVTEKKIGDTLLKTYSIAQDEVTNQLALSAAENALAIFENKFGDYPYDTYSVVETNFAGGMEYPGIVFISRQYYNKNYPSDYLEIVVAHETAHQWWYATVGNNQIDEAWLDESFASYSEVIYFQNQYGNSIGKNYFNERVLASYERDKAQLVSNGNTVDEVILKPVNKFNGWSDYGSLVYRKGAILLNELRNQVGDEIFFEILQNYYQEYHLKIANTEDFIQVVEKVTSNKWETFFDDWLYGKPIEKSAS